MRYEVRPDGGLARGKLFFDLTAAPGAEALDGLKVDKRGNVYVSGPGGIWILSPAAKHLGTITGPELAANFAWGDADGRTLYLTARTGVYRLRLGVEGRRPEVALAPVNTATFVRLDPRFDALVPRDAVFEKLAGRFEWVEGPAWNARQGALYFSDIPANVVYRWREGSGIEVAVEQSGYSGAGTFSGREPGSNGLLFDAQGRLLLCQHGDRRIVRLESNGTRTILANRYEGKRLNSPNDLVWAPDGALWFTDPPFGLPRAFEDPAKELAWSGVYRLAPDGRLALATRELDAPNGLAFAPDGKTLYVSNADPERALWMAYDVLPGGRLGPGRVFFDATPFMTADSGSCDGLKTDDAGNLFATGPGGLWVFAADGTLLGKILTGVKTANCAFADGGATLYVTADTAIYRLRLRDPGVAAR
jgi:gluconolactonase